MTDDHEPDYCEHEMAACAGGCPPYGYCTSAEHHADELAPAWPCDEYLAEIGQTREEWIAEEERALDEWVAALKAEDVVTA